MRNDRDRIIALGLRHSLMYVETLRADFEPSVVSAFLASCAFCVLFFTSMLRYFRMRIEVDPEGILIFDQGTPNQFIWSEVLGVVNEGTWFRIPDRDAQRGLLFSVRFELGRS